MESAPGRVSVKTIDRESVCTGGKYRKYDKQVVVALHPKLANLIQSMFLLVNSTFLKWSLQG